MYDENGAVRIDTLGMKVNGAMQFGSLEHGLCFVIWSCW